MSLSTKRAWELVRSAWLLLGSPIPSGTPSSIGATQSGPARFGSSRCAPLHRRGVCAGGAAAWKGPGDSSPQKTARAGATHRAGHGAEELRPPSDRTLPQCVTWFFSANGTYL